MFSQVGQSFDLLGNRYLNLRECHSRRVDPGNWDDVDNTALSPYTGSNAGNSLTASDCPAPPAGTRPRRSCSRST